LTYYSTDEVYILLTGGGICEKKKEWIGTGYLPFDIIHMKWQHQLSSMVKEQIPTERI
jgi:hypothetical protein